MRIYWTMVSVDTEGAADATAQRKGPPLAASAKPRQTIGFLNQRWCEYIGLSFEEGGGWGWRGAIHSEELHAL